MIGYQKILEFLDGSIGKVPIKLGDDAPVPIGLVGEAQQQLNRYRVPGNPALNDLDNVANILAADPNKAQLLALAHSDRVGNVLGAGAGILGFGAAQGLLNIDENSNPWVDNLLAGGAGIGAGVLARGRGIRSMDARQGLEPTFRHPQVAEVVVVPDAKLEKIDDALEAKVGPPPDFHIRKRRRSSAGEG